MNQKSVKDISNDEKQSEVDLIKVAMRLWRGKWTVLFCVIISLATCMIYLKHSKEKWVSSALITRPAVGEISPYIDILGIIYGEDAPKISDSQKLFLEQFKSSLYTLSLDYMGRTSDVISFDTLDIDQAKNAALSPLAPTLPFRISYMVQRGSAEEAQRSLISLIHNANDVATERLKKDLVASLNHKLFLLKNELLIQKNLAAEKKLQRVSDVEQSLKLANELNIKKSKAGFAEYVSNDKLFMLGSDNLELLLQNYKNSPVVLSDKYYAVDNKIKILESVDIKNINIGSYDYLMRPFLPTVSMGPKKIPLIAFSILFVCMLGAIVVLGYGAFRKYWLEKA